ncbi:MAG: DUF2478 domain-containing protein [Paracoccus sp. (in: a-proteobacteria)]|nr:DUF2478 domain-containing protein [Paracoccus sp. (in: a-proteobacteria)]
MLGWFGLDRGARGEADALLHALAMRLTAEGWRLAGAVQSNLIRTAHSACDMELHLLGRARTPVRISQSLGQGATGCRLDGGALAKVAGWVESDLDAATPDLLIVPKFGRQEAAGGGFRQAIARAICADVPVLLHVPVQQRHAFLQFSDGVAQQIDPRDLRAWCAGLRT